MNKILIMTDSASDIPKELEKEHSIHILSFPITVGDKGYLERVDFSNKEFYDILDSSPKIPTTSQITSTQFLIEFEEIKEQGYEEVIYVSINSKGSSTYSSALMAKEQFYNRHKELANEFKIHVVDSKSYSIAYGYPVVESAKKVKKGASSTEILAYLDDWFNSVEIYFAPYTLEYVKKSGRVPVAAAFVGELVGLRPIISIIDGETKIVQKVRGDKAIVPALIKYANNFMIPKTPYMVLKGVLDDGPNELYQSANKQFNYKAEDIFNVGACIAINAGPKIAGIVVKGKNRKCI